MPRSRVQKNLIIPAEYFLNRGFSAKILTDFDVGVAKQSKAETRDRVIVPIYNEDEYLIGYTCRSIFDRCEVCGLYHRPEGTCPTHDFEKNISTKWRHMDFNANSTLYNFDRAKPNITKSQIAILVEGPADVWKLSETGYKNAVGLFGNTLHEGQVRLLSSAGCMRIICLLDNDPAGHSGMRSIKEKYGRLFTMFFPTIPEGSKDLADLNSDAVTHSVKPIIDKIVEIYKQ